MGTGILVLGIFLLFENCAAENKSRAARDQMRSLILLLSLFGISWWFSGNAWSATREEWGGRAARAPGWDGEGGGGGVVREARIARRTGAPT